MVTTTYKAGQRPRIQVRDGVWKDAVLTKINSKTAYFRAAFIVGELAVDVDQVSMILHADGTPVLESEQWPPLTPYDTGKRLVPQVWVLGDRRRPAEHDEDRYGRVDFDDDTSTTILTVYVERGDDGQHTVHIETMGEEDVPVVLNGEPLSHGGTS